MKKITQLTFFLLVALLLSCGGESYPAASNEGGISGTGNGGSKSSLSGSAYKGPFIQDGEVNVISIEGDNGSVIANSQIRDNLGDFILEVEPGLLSVSATGRFYDETEATYSEESVTLKALVNKDPEQQASILVNALTLLSHDLAVELIIQGNSYEQATADAQSRVKTVLAAVTGDIPTSQPFINMNIINSPGTTPEDNAYSLYISSLFTEAVNERSIEEPYTMTTLLNTLREDVINNNPIDDVTLLSLQEANGRLDAASIQQNLEAVLIGETIAPIGEVIETVSPGLVPPSNLTTSVNTTGEAQQFCFDMTVECSNPEHKAEIITAVGYAYDLQIDDNADFSSPIVNLTDWRRNFFDVEHASLGSGTRYFRVRKSYDDGQLSLWAQTDFVVP
ncbi:MAG: hypothetical protein ABNH27_07915 [Alcanivorax sp.]|jgi:hypothetical protein|uniref:hypothetical protein n=1 Tax=Alcanivorax sp. TaxID=1872427 RepID=UPI000C690FEE|nr:hypothetical protein [Alcanivorax sp.]